MSFLRQLGIVAALLLQLLPALADDVITNIMSPIVSYQYPNDVGSEALTNGGVMSSVVSYHYFDWAGDDVVPSQSSPAVSYFYQSGSEPLPLVLHGRVANTLGVGISGATVSATVGLTPAAQTTTDAGGNYALPPLGAGVYALAANASGHARSARAVTLNAATATQNFQLTPLPAAPTLTQTDRQPPTVFTEPPVGPMGSTLKVFDGAQFVAITAGNTPPPDRMTDGRIGGGGGQAPGLIITFDSACAEEFVKALEGAVRLLIVASTAQIFFDLLNGDAGMPGWAPAESTDRARRENGEDSVTTRSPQGSMPF